MPPPPLLIAAHGDRGRQWAAVARRSRRMELRAVIDLCSGGLEGLGEALDALPGAAVAVWAAGPREAGRTAERLVEHDGPALLHPCPWRAPAGAGVQLSHGWLSLSGIGALQQLLGSRAVEVVELSVRGLPEGPASGLGPALYHAATVVHRLGARIEVEGAVLPSEQELELSLNVDGVPWRVNVGARGEGLSLVTRTAEGDFTWSVDAVSESLRRPGAEPRVIPLVPWAERCLRQLVTPVVGTDLPDARRARALLDAVELRLERRLPPERWRLSPLTEPAVVASGGGPQPPGAPSAAEVTDAPSSASAPMEPRPSSHHRYLPSDASDAAGLGRLGLAGELPVKAPLAPRPPPSAELPFEALAYVLGLRPATFLTVLPQDEARIRGLLPGAVERRERRAEIEPGDRWRDDRDRGEPRVELYAAKDEQTARRLARLQEEDPTASLSEIGALLGYPACCVQAFASQADRSDNSYNRYAIAARTAVGPGPWPALLDDTSLKLLPHFACTYRCERSREQALGLLDALQRELPELARRVTEHLGGPVLYFDHDHQIRLAGHSTDPASVAYRAVSLPWGGSDGFGQLAGALSEGDRLVLGDAALTVYRGDERLLSLERTDPGLGMLLPFAPAFDSTGTISPQP